MIAFLIDEMFPVEAAALLREQHGLDALHVGELGLSGADDSVVAAVARADGRAVVTENVADFVKERDLTMLFVLKQNLPSGGGQGASLADELSCWAAEHPDPYVGQHWLS